jgi:hypothetical protein
MEFVVDIDTLIAWIEENFQDCKDMEVPMGSKRFRIDAVTSEDGKTVTSVEILGEVDGSTPPGNGDPPVIDAETLKIKFVPLWERGGNVTTPPNIGSGQLKGELVATPQKEGGHACRINIDIVSARSPVQTNPGVASGSHEFYLPEMGKLELSDGTEIDISLARFLPEPPELDADGNLVEHNFVRGSGGGVMYAAGDGPKHYVVGPKWTFREWRSGGPASPRAKIIIIVNNDEWKDNNPKSLMGNDWNITFSQLYST